MGPEAAPSPRRADTERRALCRLEAFEVTTVFPRPSAHPAPGTSPKCWSCVLRADTCSSASCGAQLGQAGRTRPVRKRDPHRCEGQGATACLPLVTRALAPDLGSRRGARLWRGQDTFFAKRDVAWALQRELRWRKQRGINTDFESKISEIWQQIIFVQELTS